MEPPDDNHTYCLPENDLSSQKCEKIAGEKENSVWLIMNNKYILHKLREFKNGNGSLGMQVQTGSRMPI